MFLEGLTTCVNYPDFLEETLPYNIPMFDRLIVVTTYEDVRTQKVCSKFGVECLKTHAFYKDGEFNKAAGINYGLAHLKLDSWCCHWDSDIVLPINFRKFILNGQLSKDDIYGMDRVNCVGRKKWEEFKAKPDWGYAWNFLVTPPKGMPLGGRVIHTDYSGFVPIGFMQLWNGKAGKNRYPMVHGTAERTDLLFALQWDKPNRKLIPEMFAIHLETTPVDNKAMGSNWFGRKTPEFSLEQKPFIKCESFLPIITDGAPDYSKGLSYSAMNQ